MPHQCFLTKLPTNDQRCQTACMARKKKKPVVKSLYRRQLAARFAQLREATGMTLTEVAQLVEVNQGSLSRIETGERGTTPVLAKALLDCYNVTDSALREDTLDLVRADIAQRNQWWRKYSAVINTTQYGGYLELESRATSLNSYEPLLVPGLLQTEEYARQVITAMRVDLGSQEIDTLVKVRMQRQELLEGEDAPKLWAIIDEAAICRMGRSQEVLKGQLEHLLALEPRTNVTLQLLPFEAGFHTGLYGSFMLMSFPEPNPDLVWVENLTNSVYFDGSEDVERYAEVFDHLRAAALAPPQTRKRLQKMIREYQ
jgi:transcriptional regulator with XRE-family HTH domain